MNELEQIDKKYILPTYARNYVNFIRGENATLYDESMKNYIDFTSGIGVVSCGHSNSEITKAICEQASKIMHISNLYLIEPQAMLAKRIVDLSGFDMRVFFANSGAEANEGAIKIARKYGEVDGEVKRYKIITLQNSFHGRTITALKATGQEKMHTYFGPYPDGFVYAKDLNDIYQKIDEKTVAVMVELIQGEGGVNPQNKKEMQKLEKELKKRDILLIVDEVQTGVYRSGEFLASNLYEIEPDIITLAKGLGGGVPIGAVLTNKKDIFSFGDHGSTFGGNYLVSSAALKVIEILEGFKNSGKLDENIIFFHEELKSILDKFAKIFNHESGIGLMRALEVKDEKKVADIIQKSFEEGVLVLKAGKNKIRFLPPITITKDEIKLGFERFERAIRAF